MRPHSCESNQQLVQARVILHLGKYVGSDPGLPPAPETRIHRVPRAEPFGLQVPPRDDAPCPPEHGFHEETLVFNHLAQRLFLAWQQRRKLCPLRVGQHTAVFIHAQRSTLIVNTPSRVPWVPRTATHGQWPEIYQRQIERVV